MILSFQTFVSTLLLHIGICLPAVTVNSYCLRNLDSLIRDEYSGFFCASFLNNLPFKLNIDTYSCMTSDRLFIPYDLNKDNNFHLPGDDIDPDRNFIAKILYQISAATIIWRKIVRDTLLSQEIILMAACHWITLISAVWMKNLTACLHTWHPWTSPLMQWNLAYKWQC